MKLRWRHLLLIGALLAASLPGSTVADAQTPHGLPFTPIAHPYVEAITAPGIEHRTAPGTLGPATTYTAQIVNRHSGKCMEVYHSSTSDAANVDQYSCNGTATQNWHFVRVGTSQNAPVDEIVNNHSGKCLEVYHSSLSNGANVDQYTCNGTATQQWLYHDPHTGVGIFFINMNSGLILEVAHSSTSNYGNVDQYIDNYTETQAWDRPIVV